MDHATIHQISESFAELSRKHVRQMEKTNERHDQSIEWERSQLMEAYEINSRQLEIERLKKELKSGTKPKTSIAKIFRKDRPIEDKIKQLEIIQAETKKQVREVVENLEYERAVDLQILEHSQNDDRERLVNRIAENLSFEPRKAVTESDRVDQVLALHEKLDGGHER